jgi:hypothetical protein
MMPPVWFIVWRCERETMNQTSRGSANPPGEPRVRVLDSFRTIPDREVPFDMHFSSQPAVRSSPSAGRAPGMNGPLLAAMVIILIGLYAFPAHMMVGAVTDYDVWWHLRTGQWIVEHRDVPRTDPFSTFGLGKDYVAYSWLYELTVYKLYQGLGLTGILVFRLVVGGAVAVAIHRFIRRREPRFLWSTGLTALTFLALAHVLFYERSWLFSMLFTLVTLDAILCLRDGTATWAVWLLPVAYVLWANVHIQFCYGVGLLGLACAAPFADVLLRRPTSGRWADAFGSPAWWRLVALTAACAAATLLNPYGFHLWSVVRTYASQSVPFQVENEMHSPSFRHYWDWAFLVLVLGGAVALGRRLPKASVFEVLLFAGTAVAGFRTRRDTWLTVFASLALITSAASPALTRAPCRRLAGLRTALVAAGVFLVGLFLWRQREISPPSLCAAVRSHYPEKAVEFIRDKGYPGPLFNTYEWGGYLIWALPEYTTSMDGRVHVHGDERLARHDRTLHGFDMDKDPELMTARLILLPDAGPLPAFLRRHSRFKQVYPAPGQPPDRDNPGVVFVAADDRP